jgi:hypothetical protein
VTEFHHQYNNLGLSNGKYYYQFLFQNFLSYITIGLDALNTPSFAINNPLFPPTSDADLCVTNGKFFV